MVHCIYERVIKLKRNLKKNYIVFCCYCCCLRIRISCSKTLKEVLAFGVQGFHCYQINPDMAYFRSPSLRFPF